MNIPEIPCNVWLRIELLALGIETIPDRTPEWEHMNWMRKEIVKVCGVPKEYFPGERSERI